MGDFIDGIEEQKNDAKDLDKLTVELSELEYNKNKNREVKLLYACCLSDLMKAYVPESPFSSEKMEKIFLFFITQLQGLENVNAALYERTTELLQQLSSMCAFTLISDSEELVGRLFKTLFDVITETHLTTQIGEYMLKIMCDTLEESDDIHQSILDIILMNIIKTDKKSPGYSLAINVIKKAQDFLEQRLSQFLVQLLTTGKDNDSEVGEHIYKIVFELNKIAPNILTHVLPEFENELLCEEVEKRKQAVDLLGRIFAEKSSHLSVTYGKLYASFLKRFYDKEEEIRKQMVHFSKYFIINHPATRSTMLEEVLRSITDISPIVRTSSLNVVKELLLERDLFSLFNEKSLVSIGERMLDRNQEVRLCAMQTLATFYKECEKQELEKEKLYSWIPSKLMTCYFQNNTSIKCVVENILDRFLLPSKPESSHSERTHALLKVLFQISDDSAQKAFRDILKEKHTFKKHFNTYLELSKENFEDLSEEEQTNFNKTLKIMSSHLPFREDRTTNYFLNLMKGNKKTKIRKHLEKLVSPETGLLDTRKTVESLFTTIGKRSVSEEFLTSLTTKICYNIISKDDIPILFSSLREYLNEQDRDSYIPLMDLLVVIFFFFFF